MHHAGEPMPPSLIFRLSHRLELWNVYGPTETIACTAGLMRPMQDVIHVGAPIPGNTAYVLQADGVTRVSPGEVGELYIGGVQVARGYLHQPQLTAERFLSDPFVSLSTSRTELERKGEHISTSYPCL
jgi:non-ribosomal peptide synthetase component F